MLSLFLLLLPFVVNKSLSQNTLQRTAVIEQRRNLMLLWSPYVIGQTIIFILFLSFFFFFFFFFSSPNLSSRRLDVYHTSAHGVVLV